MSARVLVVDDVEVNVKLLEAKLSSEYFDVLTASNGAAALAIAAAESPDLILLDVMMPKISGFEVCKRIKANPETSDIVVLMVTALDQPSDIDRAVEARTDDFLTKPINNGEYMAKSSLLGIMGRMACYTGQQVEWDQALNSEENLFPANLRMDGPLSVPEVARPGITRLG